MKSAGTTDPIGRWGGPWASQKWIAAGSELWSSRQNHTICDVTTGSPICDNVQRGAHDTITLNMSPPYFEGLICDFFFYNLTNR